VILSQDGYGIYDEKWATAAGGTTSGYASSASYIERVCSDASIAMKFGHVARAACLAFPTQNTHGYEMLI